MLLPMAYSPPSYVSQSGFEGFQQNRTFTVSPEKVNMKDGDIDETNTGKLEKLMQYINDSPVTRDERRKSSNGPDVTRKERSFVEKEKDRIHEHLIVEVRLKKDSLRTPHNLPYPFIWTTAIEGL